MPAKRSSEFQKWLKNRHGTRDAHRQYSQQPAEEWLTTFEIDAAAWIARLESEPQRGVIADIRRAAFKYLEECSVFLAEPPPPSLVKLIGLLIGIKPAQRRVKSRKKFMLVAKFVAENPKASPSKIRREVGSDLRQLKVWMASAEFRKTVDRIRASRSKKLGG